MLYSVWTAPVSILHHRFNSQYSPFLLLVNILDEHVETERVGVKYCNARRYGTGVRTPFKRNCFHNYGGAKDENCRCKDVADMCRLMRSFDGVRSPFATWSCSKYVRSRVRYLRFLWHAIWSASSLNGPQHYSSGTVHSEELRYCIVWWCKLLDCMVSFSDSRLLYSIICDFSLSSNILTHSLKMDCRR